MASYRPMTVADLAARLSRAADDRTRWKLVWEFLEEYRWEPGDAQPALLADEPPSTGDERWDALLAALAEHLAAKDDLAPPDWAELRILRRPWFPAQLAHFLRHGTRLGEPGLARQKAILLEHYHAMLSHFGREPGLRMARKHLAWYSRGLPGSAEFRATIMRLGEVDAVLGAIDAFYDPLIARGATRAVTREHALAEAA